MIDEECVLEFFQGLESRGQGQGLDDFKIVLEDEDLSSRTPTRAL